jgi:hypothetical protein
MSGRESGEAPLQPARRLIGNGPWQHSVRPGRQPRRGPARRAALSISASTSRRSAASSSSGNAGRSLTAGRPRGGAPAPGR